mmetsp:Transcript_16428/g.14347  ORF Transcript_16428/g.14347 Transcript_16428/m.14347 type:complete len:187 (+) Transcript_16428:35-595(+)
MSVTNRENEEGANEDDKLMKENEEEVPLKTNPTMFVLTESVLLIASIPTALFFIFGAINGLILLTEHGEYLTCVALKKIAATNSNDISDHMEDFLTGATTVCWVLVVLYAQILFVISKFLYPFSGLIYLISLIGGLIFHIVGIIWIADNDCTDTKFHRLALANSVIFFILLLFILIGSLVVFLMHI